MSDLYLFDTSIWVLLLRRHRSGDLVARTTELIQTGYGATNGVVRLEVLVGCRDEADFERVERRLSALTDLPLTGATWQIAANLGFSLRRRGITLSATDLIIAASALENDAVLVHADSDFDRIAASCDLQVESYAATSP